MKVIAGPGYVVYRRLRIKEEKTKGGIVLPKTDEKMSAECIMGQCIDSGEHVSTGRTGRLGGGIGIRNRGWLPTGCIFEIKPVSEKPSRIAPGVYSCLCEQVDKIWEILPEGVELEFAEV